MSGTAGRSCIEREYNEAKETARAYLRALGVLDPGGISTREHRERDERLTRDGIRMGTGEALELPSDPSASRATVLARRYLSYDRDDRIVDELLENADSPANRVALEALKRELTLTGAEMPDRLRAWEPECGNPKRRWRREPTRNHRIGLVVEALVTGKNVLVWSREPERKHEQLQGDLKAVYEAAGRPIEEVSSEEVIESLNKMKARPWRHLNGGEGMRENDLVELTSRWSDESAGVDGILTEVKVRMHFPNLYPTANDATKDTGSSLSICDAVADVLREAGQRGTYRTVLRAWKGYRGSHQFVV